MGMKSVWGFDPDEVMRNQRFRRGQLDEEESAYTADEQRAAQIPVDAEVQIYQLQRLFRL
jgi:hypothetical protein